MPEDTAKKTWLKMVAYGCEKWGQGKGHVFLLKFWLLKLCAFLYD